MHSNPAETSLVLLTARNELFILEIRKKVVVRFFYFLFKASFKSKNFYIIFFLLSRLILRYWEVRWFYLSET